VSPLWEAIENLVVQQKGERPFEDLSLRDDVLRDYQPSPDSKTRFDLIEGHERYKRDPKIEENNPDCDFLWFAKTPSDFKINNIR